MDAVRGADIILAYPQRQQYTYHLDGTSYDVLRTVWNKVYVVRTTTRAVFRTDIASILM